MININGKNVEVHVKSGFSERKGIKRFSEIVQIDSLTTRSRNLIYTCIGEYIEKLSENYKSDEFIEYIYVQLLSLTKDDIPMNYSYTQYDIDEVMKFIKQIILQTEYSDVYDFIEGLIRYIKQVFTFLIDAFEQDINNIFIDENINYRIVGHIVTDVVNNEEIKSIEKTLASPYDIVKKHYNQAIEKLYKDQDYANSIKESISAVEAMCQIINGGKEELNKALKNLKIKIHPALEQAYVKLYAYTCDENGARHANGIGEKNATLSEARYMLISCSAFVNYLKENFEKKEE